MKAVTQFRITIFGKVYINSGSPPRNDSGRTRGAPYTTNNGEAQDLPNTRGSCWLKQLIGDVCLPQNLPKMEWCLLKYLTVAQVSLIARPRAGRLSSSVMSASRACEFARKYVVDVDFIRSSFRSSFKLRRKSKGKSCLLKEAQFLCLLASATPSSTWLLC